MTIVMLAGVIIGIGQFIKGVTGSASALFAIPLLVLFMDIKFVLPMFILLDATTGVIMFIKERKLIRYDVVKSMYLGILIGSIMGILLFSILSSGFLKNIFGFVIIGMAIHLLYAKNTDTKHKSNTLLASISGWLAGFMGALFGVNGPPVMYYSSLYSKNKTVFRATVVGVFLADAITRIIGYSVMGIMTFEAVLFALKMLPFLLVGVYLGNKVHFKVKEKLFKTIIGVIVLITGIIAAIG